VSKKDTKGELNYILKEKAFCVAATNFEQQIKP
jgi:hypothetical protein